jgi:chemotaxis signal transduction protein
MYAFMQATGLVNDRGKLLKVVNFRKTFALNIDDFTKYYLMIKI